MSKKFDDSTTLKELNNYLRDNFEDGVNCPCCGRFVKMYKRKITSSMAYGLILLTKMFYTPGLFDEEQKPFHLEDRLKEISGLPASIRGDMPKLRFWGFIKKVEGERKDGSSRLGLYTVTKRGYLFANDRWGNIQKYAHVYNDTVIGFSGNGVKIEDCLGSKFSYKELMAK